MAMAASASIREELKQCRRKVKSPPVSAFILQDLRDVGVGVAGVDGEGQAGQAGSADVGAEVGLLHVAGGAVVEVVQAGLADADDPGVGG